jgi:antirestriction protein
MGKIVVYHGDESVRINFFDVSYDLSTLLEEASGVLGKEAGEIEPVFESFTSKNPQDIPGNPEINTETDLKEALEVCEYANAQDREEAVAAWLSVENWDQERFEECYIGEFDDEYEFGKYLSELGEEIPKRLQNYIDYEKYANDVLTGWDAWSEGHHYFWSY